MCEGTRTSQRNRCLFLGPENLFILITHILNECNTRYPPVGLVSKAGSNFFFEHHSWKKDLMSCGIVLKVFGNLFTKCTVPPVKSTRFIYPGLHGSGCSVPRQSPLNPKKIYERIVLHPWQLRVSNCALELYPVPGRSNPVRNQVQERSEAEDQIWWRCGAPAARIHTTYIHICIYVRWCSSSSPSSSLR